MTTYDNIIELIKAGSPEAKDLIRQAILREHLMKADRYRLLLAKIQEAYNIGRCVEGGGVDVTAAMLSSVRGYRTVQVVLGISDLSDEPVGLSQALDSELEEKRV
ncbi:MAG: hypothetical protein PHQ40_16425 [Anaerolineaceae bacterium]|nr:hypothetical protein [Anaerolineaceae bacterium]